MKKYHCYSAEFDHETEILFKEAVFLGQGNNGVVYKLPNERTIKIFVEEKVCKGEVFIFQKTVGSKYFPKMLKYGRLYILREMVEGIQLDKYIKKYGIDKELTENIYKMIREFKRLKFSKLDTRCKDIYVNKNKKIMLIDPKKFYSKKVSFPRHLMKGFLKLGVLKDFFGYLGEIDKQKEKEWKLKFNAYWDKEKLKDHSKK